MANLTAAKMELTFKYPFFSSILLKRTIKERMDISTIQVSNDGTIYYNPEFIQKFSLNELVFILAHEVMHYVCMHGIRCGSRDPKVWNDAGDLFINSFLISSHVGDAPDGIPSHHKYVNKTTEEIYSEICWLRQKKKNTPFSGEGENSNLGSNAEDGEDNKANDQPLENGKTYDPLSGDLLYEGAKTDAERSEVECQVKLDIAGAQKIAKSRGMMPGTLSRLVDTLLTKETPWYELLEKYFIGFINQKQSWKRPNRRFASLDKYLPSIDTEVSMGTVVVGVDTSGSISNKMLQYFGGHLNAIIEQCHPEKVYVVYCDAKIQHVDEFAKDDYPIVFKPMGGGGTDMRKIVRWVKKEELEPDVLLILTDGYTPSDCEPSCPLVWLTTDIEKFSCGKVIKIDCMA